MFSFWRSSILSANHHNSNLVRVPLLLLLVVVYESEAHKMKYCGPKLIRKMFAVCEAADCTQFGSLVNPDNDISNLGISDHCCKRGCTHRDVEAFCCGVDPSLLLDSSNNTPKVPSNKDSVPAKKSNTEKNLAKEDLPELWKPFYFI